MCCLRLLFCVFHSLCLGQGVHDERIRSLNILIKTCNAFVQHGTFCRKFCRRIFQSWMRQCVTQPCDVHANQLVTRKMYVSVLTGSVFVILKPHSRKYPSILLGVCVYTLILHSQFYIILRTLPLCHENETLLGEDGWRVCPRLVPQKRRRLCVHVIIGPQVVQVMLCMYEPLPVS